MKTNSEMTIKDQVILNIASSPISFKKKSSLDILLHLEKKYPDYLSIKRKIVQFFIANDKEKDAVNKLIFIVKQFMDEADIIKLIVHSFNSNLLDQVFFEFKHFSIFEFNSEYDFFIKALNLMRSKIPNINFDKYFKSNNNVFYDGVLSDYSYLFAIRYNQLTRLAEEGKLKDFFNYAMQIFRVDGCFEVLETLKKYQKIEILYFLSKKGDIFKKYYLETCTKISNELILLPLEIALFTKDYDTLRIICDIFTDKPL